MTEDEHFRETRQNSVDLAGTMPQSTVSISLPASHPYNPQSTAQHFSISSILGLDRSSSLSSAKCDIPSRCFSPAISSSSSSSSACSASSSTASAAYKSLLVSSAIAASCPSGSPNKDFRIFTDSSSIFSRKSLEKSNKISSEYESNLPHSNFLSSMTITLQPSVEERCNSSSQLSRNYSSSPNREENKSDFNSTIKETQLNEQTLIETSARMSPNNISSPMHSPLHSIEDRKYNSQSPVSPNAEDRRYLSPNMMRRSPELLNREYANTSPYTRSGTEDVPMEEEDGELDDEDDEEDNLHDLSSDNLDPVDQSHLIDSRHIFSAFVRPTPLHPSRGGADSSGSFEGTNSSSTASLLGQELNIGGHIGVSAPLAPVWYPPWVAAFKPMFGLQGIQT